MSEHQEQVDVVKWFKTQFPKWSECIIAIPNGSVLSGSIGQRCGQVNKLKKEGMKKGCSDLFIAVPKETK